MIKHDKITQDMVVSMSADYFLVVKPGLKPLYNSEDYPQPDNSLPQRIHSRHTGNDNLAYEMPGVATSIVKDILFVALKRVLGELIGNGVFLGYLLGTAVNIDYMEFSTRSSTLDAELLVERIYSDNLFANIEVYMVTLSNYNESSYIYR